MEESNNQLLINAPLTNEQKNTIKDQLKCICKIYINDKKKVTGFFCNIINNHSKELLPVLITNNSLFNKNDEESEKTIKISFYDNENLKQKEIKIENKRKVYTSEKYDITIIEIKKEKDEINNYMELDPNIFQDNINDLYSQNSIYILGYPENKSPSIYFEEEKNPKIFKIYQDSSGGPILSLKEQKVIGIHKGGDKFDINKGIFLKYPIEEFFTQFQINKLSFTNNEIEMKIQVFRENIFNNTYFLYGLDNNNHLKELNESNVELFLNGQKTPYQKFFIPEKEGIYSIKLKLAINMKDCSYMFAFCENLIDINLSSFNTEKVTNMAYMFAGCKSLESIDLSTFDTKNVNNMEYMFFDCEKLSSIDLSCFDTKKVLNMSNMFSICKNLSSIDLSLFNTKNVTSMTYMFYRCEKLKSLDLSFFETEKITNKEYMFLQCKDLRKIILKKNFFKNIENIYDKNKDFIKQGYCLINSIEYKYNDLKIESKRLGKRIICELNFCNFAMGFQILTFMNE